MIKKLCSCTKNQNRLNFLNKTGRDALPALCSRWIKHRSVITTCLKESTFLSLRSWIPSQESTLPSWGQEFLGRGSVSSGLRPGILIGESAFLFGGQEFRAERAFFLAGVVGVFFFSHYSGILLGVRVFSILFWGQEFRVKGVFFLVWGQEFWFERAVFLFGGQEFQVERELFLVCGQEFQVKGVFFPIWGQEFPFETESFSFLEDRNSKSKEGFFLFGGQEFRVKEVFFLVCGQEF